MLCLAYLPIPLAACRGSFLAGLEEAAGTHSLLGRAGDLARGQSGSSGGSDGRGERSAAQPEAPAQPPHSPLPPTPVCLPRLRLASAPGDTNGAACSPSTQPLPAPQDEPAPLAAVPAAAVAEPLASVNAAHDVHEPPSEEDDEPDEPLLAQLHDQHQQHEEDPEAGAASRDGTGPKGQLEAEVCEDREERQQQQPALVSGSAVAVPVPQLQPVPTQPLPQAAVLLQSSRPAVPPQLAQRRGHLAGMPAGRGLTATVHGTYSPPTASGSPQAQHHPHPPQLPMQGMGVVGQGVGAGGGRAALASRQAEREPAEAKAGRGHGRW